MAPNKKKDDKQTKAVPKSTTSPEATMARRNLNTCLMCYRNHESQNCTQACCGRCGKLWEHWEAECDNTSMPGNQLWPRFNAADRGTMEEAFQSGRLGRVPVIKWKKAVEGTKAEEDRRAKMMKDQEEADKARKKAAEDAAKAAEKADRVAGDDEEGTTDGQGKPTGPKPQNAKPSPPLKAKVIVPDKPSPFTKDYHPITMADLPQLEMPARNTTPKATVHEENTKLIATNYMKGPRATPDAAALRDKCKTLKKSINPIRRGLGEAEKDKYHTVRPSLSKTPAKIVVSNHFELDIEPEIFIYHYSVTMAAKKDDGKPLILQQKSEPQIKLDIVTKVEQQILGQLATDVEDLQIGALANAATAGDQPRHVPGNNPGNGPGDEPGDGSGDNSSDGPGDSSIDKVDEKSCSRTIKKMVISQVLTDCTELQSNSKNFATDFVATIVSWKELFEPKTGTEKYVWEGTVALRPQSDKDRKLFEVRIVREETVSLDNFMDHVKAMPKIEAVTCNTTHVARLLNIFVSRHVYQNAMDATTTAAINAKTHAYHSLRRKYFSVKDSALLKLRGAANNHPFMAMRGFWTNVVPGFGSAYLNVNIGASAFYTPMTVSLFLNYFQVKGMLREAQRMLNRVRVYICPDRDGSLNAHSARIKTIQGCLTGPLRKGQIVSHVFKA